MAEVRALYLKFAVVRNVAAALMCAAAILAIVLKKRCVWRSLVTGSLAALCPAAAIGIAAALCFDPMFTLFHKLFFNNDLWLFNPNTSMLINIFPEELFTAAALRIFIAFGLLRAVFCLIGYAMQKNNKKERK
jgi:integral membrane protein (TIGR01906 family)